MFAPKYRRMMIYGKIKADIGVILMKLCEKNGVNIIAVEACPDPYTYVGGNTAEDKCSAIYGVYKKKKVC